MRVRGTRNGLAFAALMLAGCTSEPTGKEEADRADPIEDDSGVGGETDDDDSGDPEPVGTRVVGSGGVYVYELGCDVVWDVRGDQCPGCDLAWDVDLEVSDRGSCSFGNDYSGELEVTRGAVYIDGDYWGAAAYADGQLAWETSGFVYGGGGYTYGYFGALQYGLPVDTDVEPADLYTPFEPLDPPEPGVVDGYAAIWVRNLGCRLAWTFDGEQCPGCDLAWEVEFAVQEDFSTCGPYDLPGGRLEVWNNATYFEGAYWGYANDTYVGYVRWEMDGYVYGTGGYAYRYYGFLDY